MEDAFLEAIFSQQGDERKASMLAYADWLQDHDDPDPDLADLAYAWQWMAVRDRWPRASVTGTTYWLPVPRTPGARLKPWHLPGCVCPTDRMQKEWFLFNPDHKTVRQRTLLAVHMVSLLLRKCRDAVSVRGNPSCHSEHAPTPPTRSVSGQWGTMPTTVPSAGSGCV